MIAQRHTQGLQTIDEIRTFVGAPRVRIGEEASERLGLWVSDQTETLFHRG